MLKQLLNRKKNVKTNEAKKIYEDARFTIIMPLTPNASCIYGNGTKWCISSTASRNYFKQYLNNLINFLFILDRNKDETDPLYKVAFAIYPNNRIEAFNAEDQRIDYKVFLKNTKLDPAIFEYKKYSLDDLLNIFSTSE